MGDPLSLSHIFNLWTRALAGEESTAPKTSDWERVFRNPNSSGKEPVSVKRVGPVGDLWVAPNNCKMTTHSFNVTVNNIKTNFPANGDVFEILSGIIWKCIAKAREESEPVTITIIRSDPNGLKPRAVRNISKRSIHICNSYLNPYIAFSYFNKVKYCDGMGNDVCITMVDDVCNCMVSNVCG